MSNKKTRPARLLAWKMLLEILHQAHDTYFPHRRLGADLTVLMVLGAAVATHSEGLPVNASKIAHYMEMSRETARRCLVDLVRLGLLVQTGSSYAPADVVPTDICTQKMVGVIKRTAARLEPAQNEHHRG